MNRAAAVLLLTAASALGEPDLADLRKQWKGFDRAQKLNTLMRLGAERTRPRLTQFESWLKDRDPIVRGQILRQIAGYSVDKEHRSRVERVLSTYVTSHLKARRKREAAEFSALHKKLRKKTPPDNVTRTGADWEDPYDERKRKLPADIKAERTHMRELVAAIEGTRIGALRLPLARIFVEHHDPDVIVRVVACFAAWKDWRTLPLMADLLRIQHHGRLVAGSDAGNKSYTTMRLKWDVYKDMLWWSRPEYVPRVGRPILKTATLITGAAIGSARELDAWLLSHGEQLRKHGVVLSDAFRRRAAVSQR